MNVVIGQQLFDPITGRELGVEEPDFEESYKPQTIRLGSRANELSPHPPLAAEE